jgi:hypothetical protein
MCLELSALFTMLFLVAREGHLFTVNVALRKIGPVVLFLVFLCLLKPDSAPPHFFGLSLYGTFAKTVEEHLRLYCNETTTSTLFFGSKKRIAQLSMVPTKYGFHVAAI